MPPRGARAIPVERHAEILLQPGQPNWARFELAPSAETLAALIARIRELPPGAYTKLKREYGRAYFDNNGLDAGHLVKCVESALDAHGAMARDAVSALLATKEKLALRKQLTAWLAARS